MQVNGNRSSVGTLVLAIVRGWEKEERAKVEFLAPAEGLPMGGEITVGVLTEVKGRTRATSPSSTSRSSAWAASSSCGA